MRALVHVLFLLFSQTAYSQEADQAPQIPPNQNTERILQNQKRGDQQIKAAQPQPTILPKISAPIGEESGQGQTNQHEEKGTEFWPPFLGYRLKVTDTLIAGFTALLFAATWLLWRSTKKLVHGADKTAERQLRAYITCDANALVGIEPGAEFRAAYTFRNDGLTPAHDFEGSAVIKLTEWPLPKNTPFPALNPDRRSKHYISPRSQMASCSESFDHSLCQSRSITQADIIQIFTAPVHGRRLVLFAEVKYSDEFGKQRITRLCAGFGGHRDIIALAQQGRWEDIKTIVSQRTFPWAWELANQHNITK